MFDRAPQAFDVHNVHQAPRPAMSIVTFSRQTGPVKAMPMERLPWCALKASRGPKRAGTAPKAYIQRSASGLIDSRHAGARPLSQSTTAFRLAKLCAMARQLGTSINSAEHRAGRLLGVSTHLMRPWRQVLTGS